LLILKNRNLELGSDIPYQTLLNTQVTRLYLEDLLPLKNLSPNLSLLKLIVVKNSEVKNLGKSILGSAETEEEFQRRFKLIEAILKSKLPQLTIEEILTMFDLRTAKMPELGAYEALVEYWQQQAKQEGLQQGEVELVIRLLKRRCGTLSQSVEEQVRSLSIPQLESLGEALLDFQGIEDLENWFTNNL
jgi:predicted transposase YdaD